MINDQFSAGGIMTFRQPQPTDPLLTINGKGDVSFSKPLVTIRNDGVLIYGEGYEPDAAARTFWEAMALHAPRMCDCGKYPIKK
jgi:hypothetical protein